MSTALVLKKDGVPQRILKVLTYEIHPFSPVKCVTREMIYDALTKAESMKVPLEVMVCNVKNGRIHSEVITDVAGFKEFWSPETLADTVEQTPLVDVEGKQKGDVLTVVVNRAFYTRSKISDRTVAVGDAFGIGIDDEKTFQVYDNVQVELHKEDIVYITGDSGSGKSLLLKDLATQINNNPEFGAIAAEPSPDPDETIIEGLGSDVNEAVTYLSYAGLNEAFIFLRKYGQLSDGQKYRYRIAKMLASPNNILVFDEFLATLDRVSAKVVAYTLQKACRKMGKTIIVATTHDDLIEDLNPTVYVKKLFGHRVEINRTPFTKQSFSLDQEIVIEEGSREDLKMIEEFHYKGEAKFIALHIYRARHRDSIVGVIVYVSPHVALKARGLTLPFYREVSDRSERLRMVNQSIERIARVIILPKWRGTGLAVRLVKNTLPLPDKPYIESLAVMAKYNPFMEHAGMTKVQLPPEIHDPQYIRALQPVLALGFNEAMLGSSQYNMSVLEGLSVEQISVVQKFCLNQLVVKKFSVTASEQPLVEVGDLPSIARVLTKRKLFPAYLIWKNPDPKFSGYPEPDFTGVEKLSHQPNA